MSRILSMNEHYIKNIDENDLFNQLTEYCKLYKSEIQSDKKDKLKKSLKFLKNKAKTLEDIFNNAQYILLDKINTFKQIQIYQAMKWELPSFAHIPLIHTIEGKKLSKRDQASTLNDYSKIGIMPDALRNYLLRLGWSYKDKEIFTLEESIKFFNLEGIGKSPSKLDMSRILSINEHYIKNINENDLFTQLTCLLYTSPSPRDP